MAERGLTYRVVQSLCSTPKTNVTAWVNYTQIKKKNRGKTFAQDYDRICVNYFIKWLGNIPSPMITFVYIM